MIQAILPGIITLIGKAIDKAVKGKDKAESLKAEITLAAIGQDFSELKAATDIIVAEAQGGSWLQRSWRPITMLFLVSLVGAHWLGYTPDNLTEMEVEGLLDIVKVGLGGYVLGRSGEKMVKAYKD